jgi:hypothetical protein
VVRYDESPSGSALAAPFGSVGFCLSYANLGYVVGHSIFVGKTRALLSTNAAEDVFDTPFRVPFFRAMSPSARLLSGASREQ